MDYHSKDACDVGGLGPHGRRSLGWIVLLMVLFPGWGRPEEKSASPKPSPPASPPKFSAARLNGQSPPSLSFSNRPPDRTLTMLAVGLNGLVALALIGMSVGVLCLKKKWDQRAEEWHRRVENLEKGLEDLKQRVQTVAALAQQVSDRRRSSPDLPTVEPVETKERLLEPRKRGSVPAELLADKKVSPPRPSSELEQLLEQDLSASEFKRELQRLADDTTAADRTTAGLMLDWWV